MKLSQKAWVVKGVGAVVAGGLALGLRSASMQTTRAPDPGADTPNDPLVLHSASSQPEGPSRRVNLLGHWLGEDLRETLVREIKTEFEFVNPDGTANLKFPIEIIGKRSKDLTGLLISDMIKTQK